MIHDMPHGRECHEEKKNEKNMLRNNHFTIGGFRLQMDFFRVRFFINKL